MRTRWLVAAAMAVLVSGCGDDPINTLQPGDEEDADAGGGRPDRDTGEPEEDAPSPGGEPHLELVTEAEPSVSFSERVAIRVAFLDGQDDPIPEATVEFTPQQDMADTTLSARTGITDEEGIAETNIIAGDQQVDFDIEISVYQDDSVTPITVRVRVQPKDSSDYLVRVNYDGPLTLSEVQVQLYDVPGLCDDMFASPTEEPSADTAFTALTMIPTAEGDIPDRAFNTPREVRFHYAIARGEGVDEDGDPAGYYVTYGCVDTLPEPELGETTIIEIDLHNLWPEVAGTYRIATGMNLINAVPDSAEPIVDAVINIFANPGLGILQLLAITITGSSDAYWEESPWDLLLEESGGEVTATTIGQIVVGLIDTLIETGLDATGEFGDTVGAIVDAINDLFLNAQNFDLNGDLVITQNPDAAGLLGDTNRVIFNELTLVWQGSEYRIVLRDGSLIQAENIPGAVVFHPTLDSTYGLALSRFDIQLNYGDILLWLIESVVFPAIFGPDVDSFENFFAYIIDCESIGEDVEDATGLSIGPAVEAACSSFRSVAATALENWVSSLTADIGNYFTLATFAENPCAMGFSRTRDEFKVMTLGEDVPGRECEWDARIRFSSDPSEIGEPMDALWYGERL